MVYQGILDLAPITLGRVIQDAAQSTASSWLFRLGDTLSPASIVSLSSKAEGVLLDGPCSSWQKFSALAQGVLRVYAVTN